jgi:two-component sensor histidine kinase
MPLQRALQGEVVQDEEFTFRFPDGRQRTLVLSALALRDEAQTIIGAVSAGLDITDRKRSEEQRQLLINELNHRVKNTLATVQSIAVQSFRQMGAASSPSVAAFQERLFALARAHDLLTRDNWDGAELSEVIGEVIEPYCRTTNGRCEVEGPHVRLTPSTALALSMAVHELATNAAKYGSLSVPGGQVSISWTVTPGEPPYLHLAWREQGGPPVALPTRKGFGTRLIERSLALELSGEVKLAYDPAGVVCTIKAPLLDSGA